MPVVNVAGIAPGALKLDGAVLANIFLGKIKTWNDPAIAALNPGVTLPNAKVTVVHRSDGSGTTFNFVNYLSKVSPEWKSSVGEGTSVQWPAGIGGKGNEGVAAYVKQIKGGIGYVELSYALQNKLSYTAMKNAAGKFVQPSDTSFAAAAASADWANARDFYPDDDNAPGAESPGRSPATNFILVQKTPKNAANGKATQEFFRWVYKNGDAQARQLDYAAAGQPGPPDRDLLVAEPEVSAFPAGTGAAGPLSPAAPTRARDPRDLALFCFRGCTCLCRAEPTLGCARRADQRSAPTVGRELSRIDAARTNRPSYQCADPGFGHLPDRRQSCETLVRT